ncbi:PAS domain-containing protein, partial [Seleniivibrio woodruffii]|uniref:PAS domain-containing protein n=1 Tax=Seleniivibrio woodruffii TaxID=1078050 RepID=UPI0039E51F9A
MTLFEDAQHPVLLLDDDSFICLNEAAKTRFGSGGMDGHLTQEIADFRMSENTKSSFSKNWLLPEGEISFEVRLKAVTEDKRKIILEFADTNDAEELKNSLFFMQSMLDSMPNPVFYKSPDGKYMGCNKMFERYIGLSKEELTGKTVKDITPHDWKYQCARTDMQILGTGQLKPYESVMTMPDGTVRNVIFSKSLLKNEDGATDAIIGTIQDITE